MSYIWTDDPLIVNIDMSKNIHITELRDHANNELTRRGLTPYIWTDETSIKIKKIHIEEIRDATDESIDFVEHECVAHDGVINNTYDSGFDNSLDNNIEVNDDGIENSAFDSAIDNSDNGNVFTSNYATDDNGHYSTDNASQNTTVESVNNSSDNGTEYGTDDSSHNSGVLSSNNAGYDGSDENTVTPGTCSNRNNTNMTSDEDAYNVPINNPADETH